MQYRLKVPLCAKFMHSETLGLYLLVVVAFVYSRFLSVLSRAVVNFVNLAHSEGEILSASGAWSGVVWRKTIFIIIFFYHFVQEERAQTPRGTRGLEGTAGNRQVAGEDFSFWSCLGWAP